jgi:hypothetical protein
VPAQRKFIIASLAFSCIALLSSCGAKAEQRSFNSNNPPLEIVTNKFTDNYEKQIVEGEVRNISGQELAGVQLLVNFLSASDRLLDISTQDLGTIAAGGTARFRVEHQDDYRAVGVTHHQLRFRVAKGGQPVPHRDPTGNQPALPSVGSGIKEQEADPGGSRGAPVAPTGH